MEQLGYEKVLFLPGKVQIHGLIHNASYLLAAAVGPLSTAWVVGWTAPIWAVAYGSTWTWLDLGVLYSILSYLVRPDAVNAVLLMLVYDTVHQAVVVAPTSSSAPSNHQGTPYVVLSMTGLQISRLRWDLGKGQLEPKGHQGNRKYCHFDHAVNFCLQEILF